MRPPACAVRGVAPPICSLGHAMGVLWVACDHGYHPITSANTKHLVVEMRQALLAAHQSASALHFCNQLTLAATISSGRFHSQWSHGDDVTRRWKHTAEGWLQYHRSRRRTNLSARVLTDATVRRAGRALSSRGSKSPKISSTSWISWANFAWRAPGCGLAMQPLEPLCGSVHPSRSPLPAASPLRFGATTLQLHRLLHNLKARGNITRTFWCSPSDPYCFCGISRARRRQGQ